MTQSISVHVNGKEYAVDSLPQAAQAQVANLRVADAEITRLQQQLALVQTARNAYAAALVAAVESATAAAPAASAAPAAAPAAAKKPATRKSAKKS